MIFTDHAIRQYIKRHAPEMTYAAAFDHLTAAGERGGVQTGRRYRGAKVYSLPVIGIEVLAKAKRDRGKLVIITVLPVTGNADPEPAEIDP